MFRRQFLQLAALVGAGALAPIEIAEAATSCSVMFHVEGFTCPTCAVGLDAMLHKQDGIVSSRSTYPEGNVDVRFKPEVISIGFIKGFITDMGFTIAGERQG